MADGRTSTTLQDQTPATWPVYAPTLSSEAVLDALKMILIGAPLNDQDEVTQEQFKEWKCKIPRVALVRGATGGD